MAGRSAYGSGYAETSAVCERGKRVKSEFSLYILPYSTCRLLYKTAQNVKTRGQVASDGMSVDIAVRVSSKEGRPNEL